MKLPFARLFPVLAAGCFAACLAGGTAAAQDNDAASQSQPSRPLFVTMPPKPGPAVRPAVTLPTWNGSFMYNGKSYTYNMVGTAPTSNAATTIPVFIIPVKIVITSKSGTKTTYDPEHVLSNGKTVVQNVIDSPLFDSTTTYTQGGVNVGTTQYIDAYQRANFWGAVRGHPNYHLILGGPTVLPEQTLNPSSSQGKTGTEFGFTAGKVSIFYFEKQVSNIISSLPQIQPNTLPIFLTYNTYLTEFVCCIGGYHSSIGAQAYAHATYVDVVGAFSQDVSALSHELGEWADDPLVNNRGNKTPCGILEVGDPLENNPNYGGYPYSVNGFNYNLQDLVTLPYFGAPAATSVNNYFTFQGEALQVCQNGS
jgi:hypothetical protein